MRVLVTGAGGFVGAHVVNHILATTDWEIVALDDYDNGPFRGRRARLEQVFAEHPRWGARLKVMYHDLVQPLAGRWGIESSKPDWIINLASESHVDRSISEPRPFVENNIALMLSVLEYARVSEIPLIHVSTDEVYGPLPKPFMRDIGLGPNMGEPVFPVWREWSPLRPSNPYSASKAAQESLLHAWWRTYGLKVAMVNCVNMIGEMQHPEKFLPTIMRSVLTGERLPIHEGINGVPGTRYYLHARNCADALCWMIENGMASDWADTSDMPRWNISSDNQIDNLELAMRVAAIMEKPLNWLAVDGNAARPGHDLHYGIDGSKLTNAGWKPPVMFDEALERTVRWTMEPKHQHWLNSFK